MKLPENIVILAKSCAKSSEYRFKLGAVIFAKHRVMGCGWNRPKKTHPKANTPYKTIHAEFDAILDSQLSSFENCSILVYRIGRDKKVRLARPCKHCCQMLKDYGLENVYYTNDDGGISKEAIDCSMKYARVK